MPSCGSKGAMRGTNRSPVRRGLKCTLPILQDRCTLHTCTMRVSPDYASYGGSSADGGGLDPCEGDVLGPFHTRKLDASLLLRFEQKPYTHDGTHAGTEHMPKSRHRGVQSTTWPPFFKQTDMWLAPIPRGTDPIQSEVCGTRLGCNPTIC